MPIGYRGGSVGAVLAEPQTSAQTKVPGVCRSPRSGAIPKNPRKFKPGESGNPAGSSWKQRNQSELRRAIKKGSVATLVQRVLNDPKPVEALRVLAPMLGLVESESTRVFVQNVVSLSDRRDRSEPRPVMIDEEGEESVRVLGSGAEQ